MGNIEINKKLLPMKAHYFLFNAGTAPVVPFMPTLVRQLGFSTVVVGTIYTVLPIVGMLVKPLFGIIADRFQRQKLLFLLFQILAAVPFFLIMFIPSIPQESTVSLHCHDASDLRYCPPNGTYLDKCLTDRITGDDTSNVTIRCQLDCKTEPWMWNTICKYWHAEKYCDASNIPPDQQLRMTGLIPSKHIELLDNCLFFVLAGAELDGAHVPLYCPANQTDFRTSCQVRCDNADINEAITHSKIDDSEAKGLYQFWLLFLFLILSWAGMAVVVSVGDAICFDMLGDRPHLYGNQRLWGSVGWGVFSLLAGFLVDQFSAGKSNKDYTVVFYMTIVIIGIDIIVSSKLKHTQSRLSSNILKDVGQIFVSFRIVIYFAWCILVGLGTAMIWNFLFWHLEDLASLQQGCDHTAWIKTLEGIVMSIQCFGGELPFFFLSGWILKKIGHVHAMSLVLLGFGVRFLLYSLLVNPWWVIPIEFMNGVTFGLFYATMASYASIVAPPGTEATMQGLVGAVFEGVGVSLGSLIAGHLFQQVGGSKTFRLFGIAALVLFVVHVLIHFVMDKLGSRGKLADKKQSMLHEAPLGANNGIEVDTIMSKSNSILSESTIQEELSNHADFKHRDEAHMPMDSKESGANCSNKQNGVFHEIDLTAN